MKIVFFLFLIVACALPNQPTTSQFKEGYLRGERLSSAELVEILLAAGWDNDERILSNAVCTAAWESSFWTQTLQYNRDVNGWITSTDYGLFQINDLYHQSRCANIAENNEGFSAAMLQPIKSARCAYRVWKAAGKSFQWWHGYSKERCDPYSYLNSQHRLNQIPSQTTGTPLKILQQGAELLFTQHSQEGICQLPMGTQVRFLRQDARVRRNGEQPVEKYPQYYLHIELINHSCQDRFGREILRGYVKSDCFESPEPDEEISSCQH